MESTKRSPGMSRNSIDAFVSGRSTLLKSAKKEDSSESSEVPKSESPRPPPPAAPPLSKAPSLTIQPQFSPPQPLIKEDSFRPPPPPSPLALSASQSTVFTSAISAFDTSTLVKLMIDEVAKVPYKKKKLLSSKGDHEVVKELLNQMNDLLGNKFLHVDFKNSVPRPVNKDDWSTVTACRRSDSGTIGIYFIQCKEVAGSGLQAVEKYEIIVAKPVSKEDFERQLFVNEITKQFFKINVPAIRFIDRSNEEFAILEKSVKSLFEPFHTEIFQSGGSSSPKPLFESHAIMLMELVQGKPLCHRTEGQRVLIDEDYRALGRLFLLDLIIRNTDRLPSRKAMPRPGVIAISDQGNAGNLMFGDKPGSLWAIDPEMQTHINMSRETDYAASLESIFNEIINDEISMIRYKSLDSLYFHPLPGFQGILDTSLEELTPWDNESKPLQKEAIASVLQMIRIRARAEDGAIIDRAGDVFPPESNSEKEWRDWIRIASPRTVIDILKFVEVHTGYPNPPSAPLKFEQGYLEALAGAILLQKEMSNPFGSLAVKHPQLFKIIVESGQIDVGFIRRMILRLSKLCLVLPYPAPTTTCDDASTGYVSSPKGSPRSKSPPKSSTTLSPMKKKFISAVMRTWSTGKKDKESSEGAAADSVSAPARPGSSKPGNDV